ncbi:MAG TPA: hypothetical protein DDW65_25415 [Firmicutes bacterium]|nr:hypothetical protein [Bacillota bacterium]
MGSVVNLLPIIQKISQYQHPGKKMLQKMVYIIQRHGINLGFKYGIHYYGPYSSELDYATHSLAMLGAIEIIPDGMTQRIHMTEIAGTLQEEHQDQLLNDRQLEILNGIINKFAGFSAFELEVLTTTDFVAEDLRRSGKEWDDAAVLAGVKTIKGDKFSEEQIRNAIAELTEMSIESDPKSDG